MVNKKEIADHIADKFSISKVQALNIVDEFLDCITASLQFDGEVNFVDFGKFTVKDRKPRTARNPQTGDKVQVAAKRAVLFKPAKALKNEIQTEPIKERFIPYQD